MKASSVSACYLKLLLQSRWYRNWFWNDINWQFLCLLALVAMVSTAPQVPIPFYPVPGIPISNDNSKSKPIEEINPIAPTVPVPGVTPLESKPREWLSSTSTVADRSRCLVDYRGKKPAAPPPSAVEIASPHQFPFVVSLLFQTFFKTGKPEDKIFNWIGWIHFQVSIFYYSEDEGYRFRCSGSLISPTKILLIANFCLYYNPTYGMYKNENVSRSPWEFILMLL